MPIKKIPPETSAIKKPWAGRTDSKAKKSGTSANQAKKENFKGGKQAHIAIPLKTEIKKHLPVL